MENHPVYTRKIDRDEDIKKVTERFLNECEPLKKHDFSGSKVFLKPNLVAPFKKATTHRSIIKAAANFVKRKGGKPVVGDSSGFEFDTEKTLELLDIYEMGKCEEFEVVNLDNEEYVNLYTESDLFPCLVVPRLIKEVDCIFNLPKLKMHSLTRVTFSIKNLMGVIHRDTRREFHAKDIEKGISLLEKHIGSDFCLIDGMEDLTRAVYGERDFRGLMAFSADALALDKYCCSVFGTDYRSIPHLKHTDREDHSFHIVEGQKKEGTPYRPSFKKKLYRTIFKYIYKLDRMLHMLGKKKSIVPQIHWYFGIRPGVGDAGPEALKKGAEICPVDAIDPNKGKIIKKRCINVRCLECIKVKPEGSFVIKGFRKPERPDG